MSCLNFHGIILTSDQVLRQLVQYELLDSFLEHLALDRVLPQLTEAEVFQWMTGLPAAQKPDDFKAHFAVSQWASQNQLASHQVEILLRRQRIEKLKQLQIDPQIEPTFLQHKADFEQVVFSRIQVDSAALAEELMFQIRDDGVEFAAVAEQSSELIHDRSVGGRIGPVRVATLPPQITQLLQSSAVGQIHVIAINDRFWIVRLEQWIAAHLTGAVRSEIRDWLFSGWVKSLVHNKPVTISDEIRDEG